MKETHQQPKIGIYCDSENVYLSQELADLLLTFANARGSLISRKVYYNSLFQNHACVIKNLQKIGFKCEDVTCSLKNSADNQLKSDLIDDVYNNQSPDIIILVSGDGDFVNPVKFLQDKQKNVIIFAQRGNVKQKLKDCADEFHFIDELPQLVSNKTQPQTNTVKSEIHYNDAIEYLTKAINNALDQKKRTGLGYINNLMSNLFPEYRGVSSIHKPDGKKFKNFSQFVNAAVNDGKVQRQGQELFLIKFNKLAA
ncbi:MAG: NYN domain-containing protein [Nostoc sp. ChiSLP02]|nr:NYN domain-containing protein [Nostoc sp. DedSLP05]MDZ8103395.1 NYN domain-containing protein [Nostoc sp. DedSLP01]MDZ8185626.1 NYN domain-containing protein [Nostoc sp. ChiSLP02]